VGRVQAGNGGPERRARREWSEAQKLRIIREAESPGVMKIDVCRRHGLHPSLLTKWRMKRAGLLGRKVSADSRTRLLPVQVRATPAPTPSAQTRASAIPLATCGSGWGAIEVEFATGRRVCVRGTVDAGMLRTVLEELSRS
jgi:transposase